MPMSQFKNKPFFLLPSFCNIIVLCTNETCKHFNLFGTTKMIKKDFNE